MNNKNIKNNFNCEETRTDCVEMYDPWTAKLADPDLINTYKNLDRRIIWLNDEVDENIMANVRQINQWVYEDYDTPVEDRQPIIIMICNWGGSMEYCSMMVDTIECAQAAGTPVYTVNTSMAASAASYIFLTGNKRFMYKRATIVIHEGSAQMSGDTEKVKAATENYKKQIEGWITFVSERSGGKLTTAYLKKHRGDDLYYTADEAIKFGLATEVVINLNQILNV